MIKITKHGIILGKTDLGFESVGVLNPAVITEGNKIHMFYRAVSSGNYSTIGYCQLSDPLTVSKREVKPALFPQHKYEEKGMEDPRIVRIANRYYLTYTAYDGVNALGALALSDNLTDFDKKGIITPQISYWDFSHLAKSKAAINQKYVRYNQHDQTDTLGGTQYLVWDKNVIFFPERINGKLHFLHRVRPDIQLVAVTDLDELTSEFWEQYFISFNDKIVLSAKYKHEVSYIGGGCPPIKTKEGWLLIYHGVHDTVNGYVYSACAALLDLENPQKEITRLPYPLFKPEFDWELKGEVNNVCFPTGSVISNDTLYIYYGAADEQIACASVNLTDLLKELLINIQRDDTST
nr:hypothetical protein [uncultured Lacibacter sp.]